MHADQVVVAKCLVYDDDYFTLPSTAAAAAAAAPHPDDGLATQEDDLTPLLELPGPGDTSSTSVVSAAPDDPLTASADSCITEVEVGALWSLVSGEDRDFLDSNCCVSLHANLVFVAFCFELAVLCDALLLCTVGLFLSLFFCI